MRFASLPNDDGNSHHGGPENLWHRRTCSHRHRCFDPDPAGLCPTRRFPEIRVPTVHRDLAHPGPQCGPFSTVSCNLEKASRGGPCEIPFESLAGINGAQGHQGSLPLLGGENNVRAALRSGPDHDPPIMPRHKADSYHDTQTSELQSNFTISGTVPPLLPLLSMPLFVTNRAALDPLPCNKTETRHRSIPRHYGKSLRMPRALAQRTPQTCWSATPRPWCPPPPLLPWP